MGGNSYHIHHEWLQFNMFLSCSLLRIHSRVAQVEHAAVDYNLKDIQKVCYLPRYTATITCSLKLDEQSYEVGNCTRRHLRFYPVKISHQSILIISES